MDVEEPEQAGALKEGAEALLDGLPSENLEPDRTRWLRAQLQALACVTERLAGDEIAWAEQLRASEPGFWRATPLVAAVALPGALHPRLRGRALRPGSHGSRSRWAGSGLPVKRRRAAAPV